MHLTPGPSPTPPDLPLSREEQLIPPEKGEHKGAKGEGELVFQNPYKIRVFKLDFCIQLCYTCSDKGSQRAFLIFFDNCIKTKSSYLV